jgi:hypothetical protein
MGLKLSGSALALYRATDEVLHYVWDPIGVASQPQARDEYQAYLPKVFGMLQDHSDPQSIAEYLTTITVERMRLSPRPAHDLSIAKLLAEWKGVIREREI